MANNPAPERPQLTDEALTRILTECHGTMVDFEAGVGTPGTVLSRTRALLQISEHNAELQARIVELEAHPSQAAGGAELAAAVGWLKESSRYFAQSMKTAIHADQNYAETILDHIAALQAKPDSGWRGIESAPKDGTPIFGACDGKVGICHWQDGFWVSGDDMETDLDGWQPLPAAPAHKATPTDKMGE